MESRSWGCGCFCKVYVCPKHLLVMAEEMSDMALDKGLQMELLDSEVSVSASERERVSLAQE